MENPERNIPRDYEDLIQMEMIGDEVSREVAVEKAELKLFSERISNFEESDLVEDEGGGWSGFENKVKEIFPEIPEDRFVAFKAAVSMHLCGL